MKYNKPNLFLVSRDDRANQAKNQKSGDMRNKPFKIYYQQNIDHSFTTKGLYQRVVSNMLMKKEETVLKTTPVSV